MQALMRQQQRELYGQRHGLLVAAVVRAHPFGGLAVEDHVKGELRQAGLDISARGGLVTREYVAPVTLAVNQQILLSELHQGILYRGVAVRVVLHGLAHDVGHLVVTAVVAALHGVEYASLHGFQSILRMRHGSLQYDVRGIVQKPVPVHARQLAYIAAFFSEKTSVTSVRPRLRGLVGRHVNGKVVGADLLFSRIFVFCHLR